MSAKEMFEKLGYKYEERDDGIIYSLDNGNYIIFFKDDKIFSNNGEDILGLEVDMEELKAINKQVEELGWK